MYCRKSVGSRRKPWGTPAVTGYSWEQFPPSILCSHLLLRKDEIRHNTQSEILQDLEFVKKTSMPNPAENPWYIKCYGLSSPRPIKSLAILTNNQ